MILEGQESRITATLGRNNEPRFEVESTEPNPDKISFGKVSDGRNRLEFAAYGKGNDLTAFAFLNGERIMLNKYKARELYAIIVKMGWKMGVQRRKGVKN